jgi:hypothetical protein
VWTENLHRDGIVEDQWVRVVDLVRGAAQSNAQCCARRASRLYSVHVTPSFSQNKIGKIRAIQVE